MLRLANAERIEMQPPDTFVEVAACRVREGQFSVVVWLMLNGRVVQVMEIDAEGESLAPFADVVLDIDEDGIADLGVAIGKGRSGNGMRYWLMRERLLQLIDIGEAPMLSRSSCEPCTLWALVSGSGEIKAARVDYALIAGVLMQVRAIQLSPLPDGAYLASILKRSETGSAVLEKDAVRFMSEQDAQDCMDGGPCD